MVTLNAYVDESHSDLPKRGANAGSGYFVMSAFVGRVEETWKPLESAWLAALAEEKIKRYHSRAHSRSVKKRERVDHQFIRLIKQHEIRGVSVVMALKPYYKFLPRLKQEITPNLWYLLEPHLFAANAITTACTRVIDLNPLDEQVFFIFDRHILFNDVEDITHSVMTNPKVARSNRIAGARHADKDKEVLLQTADLLAGEQYRYRMGERDRWQFQVLSSGGQLIRPDVINSKFMRSAIRQAKYFNEELSSSLRPHRLDAE